MPYLIPPEYDYSYYYDNSISHPLEHQQNEDHEIRRTKENIIPAQGFNLVRDTLSVPGTSQKFVYTVRHGKAHHNALSKEYSKPISWRFLGKLADNFDPSLTNDGVNDAKHAGQIVREIVEQNDAPRPVTVYTSPLRRCIQTAMHTIASMQPAAQPLTLHVKEGLREWKGYDHNHQSDRRDVSSAIIKLFDGLKRELGLSNVQLKLDPGAQDEVDDLEMKETYVDVDRRVRKVLDDIFDKDDADCVMLVLHNRSNKSLLRVLGHTQNEVHGLDMENCAVLGYLMGRELLDEEALDQRAAKEKKQWVRDRNFAEAEKKERHKQAEKDIRAYQETNRAKLWRLRDYLARPEGGKEAARALEDLYNLAPELIEQLE